MVRTSIYSQRTRNHPIQMRAIHCSVILKCIRIVRRLWTRSWDRFSGRASVGTCMYISVGREVWWSAENILSIVFHCCGRGAGGGSSSRASLYPSTLHFSVIVSPNHLPADSPPHPTTTIPARRCFRFFVCRSPFTLAFTDSLSIL